MVHQLSCVEFFLQNLRLPSFKRGDRLFNSLGSQNYTEVFSHLELSPMVWHPALGPACPLLAGAVAQVGVAAHPLGVQPVQQHVGRVVGGVWGQGVRWGLGGQVGPRWMRCPKLSGGQVGP